MEMHPAGIEPALKASEASVLSIRLRVLDMIFITSVIITQIFAFVYKRNKIDWNISRSSYLLLIFFAQLIEPKHLILK